jgi:hypothetical protein
VRDQRYDPVKGLSTSREALSGIASWVIAAWWVAPLRGQRDHYGGALSFVDFGGLPLFRHSEDPYGRGMLRRCRKL